MNQKLKYVIKLAYFPLLLKRYPDIWERSVFEGLLLLKVCAFSRVPSCWRRACKMPVLLRDTGRVRDFLSGATGPAPSWLLLAGGGGGRNAS